MTLFNFPGPCSGNCFFLSRSCLLGTDKSGMVAVQQGQTTVAG